MNNSHQPPQDLAAERGVLGGVLVYGEGALSQVADLLTPSDFYDRRHGQIYAAMLSLYDKSQPVDEITVTSRLNDESRLDAVGGPAYLAELDEILLAPAQVEHYASLIKDKSHARAFINAASQAINLVQEANGDISEALEQAEAGIFAANKRASTGGPVPLAHGLKAVLDDLGTRKEPGIPTGFPSLDHLTLGLHPGDLTVVAGRPGMGKSALAGQVGRNIAASGLPVVIFSLEMSEEQLLLRLLSSEAGVPFQKLRARQLYKEHWAAITPAADTLAALPLHLDDSPAPQCLANPGSGPEGRRQEPTRAGGGGLSAAGPGPQGQGRQARGGGGRGLPLPQGPGQGAQLSGHGPEPAQPQGGGARGGQTATP